MYEYKQLQQVAKAAADALQLDQTETEQELMTFTGLLENYRENYRESKSEKSRIIIPEATVTQCINFLKMPKLLNNLNEKIGQSGIVGEESNRLFLFLIATSYKMPFTLHALIQGSSGSGKTRLMQTISRLMPPEDVKSFTRVTDNSFYNYGEYDLENKLLCFEDIDGLKEEALLALRELQSNDILISSTSLKDDNGKISSGERIVRGPIASLSATTRGDYYEDNISRSFVIAVDESPEQTNRVIEYQNKKAGGDINTGQEQQIRDFIQNSVRLLKPLEVVNPYASKIRLPRQAHKIRRLNEMYQSIVKQIVILHQYQRRQDRQGRLVAQKEDLQHACEILFESIVLKIDELEGDLRQFYEQLKHYVQQRSTAENKPLEEIKFNRFEIRSITGTGKTQQHRYIQRLLDLEYLQQYGYANRGYTYRISLWDNMLQIRQNIKNELAMQMQEI
jgi:energy-coupling factor transporter ATP-binding protein EcfA2